MRFKAVLCCAGLAPLAGCNMAYYASYNLVNDSVTQLDEHKLSKRLRAEARAAWREVCRQYPGRTFSDEFTDGFQEGYADYLENGRVAQPPAVPPVRYRRSRYLTPEGHALIKDYFAGFKYGADVAVATGRREFLTVPILLPDPRPEMPLNLQIPVPPEAGPTGLGAAVAGGWVIGLYLPPPAPPGAGLGAPAPLPDVPPAPGPGPLVPAPPGGPGLGNPAPPKDGVLLPPKPDPKPPGEPPTVPPAPGGLKPASAMAERAPAPAAPLPAATPPPAHPPVPDPPAPVPAAPNPK
jgi:hypothetical protein